MISINDLTGITEHKRAQAIECLDDLLTFRDNMGKLSPVITGYNWYTTLPKSDSVVTFSNIHETEAYKQAMLQDLTKLRYNPDIILKYIRDKAGAFLWELDFEVRTERGDILPGLKIKDVRTKQHIDLAQFAKPLINYPQFEHFQGYLLSENQGWELDMPFADKSELLKLVNLFLKKSGKYTYDEKGEIVEESNEERELRSPWSDAYETPVLLLGEKALRYSNELPQFIAATKLSLKENSNEIGFVVHKNIERLRNLPHYYQLLRAGFLEEKCLGNKPFIKEYVDKKR